MAAHQKITHDWWEKRKNDFDIYISQFVLDEIGAGDPDAAKKRLDAIQLLFQQTVGLFVYS